MLFTAKRSNAVLGRAGTFWEDEYFDRCMRDLEHFEQVMWYMSKSPCRGRAMVAS